MNTSEIKAVIDGLIATSIGDDEVTAEKPQTFQLNQNYPNPFNPTTTISFTLPEQDFITIEIYNITGQKLTTLLEGSMKSGLHEIEFNAADLPSGLYFYKLSGSKYSAVRRMAVVK